MTKGMNVLNLFLYYLIIVSLYCRFERLENNLLVYNVAFFLGTLFIAEAKDLRCALGPSHLDRAGVD